MATQFAPVELATIKQGEFLKECEDAFRRLNEQMIAFVQEHEVNSQALLTMKVAIKYDAKNNDTKNRFFVVVTDIEEKMPKAPAKATTAFVEADPVTGELCLFSQSAGTTKGNPRQSLLCSDDGNEIDQETGKKKAG